MHTSKISPALTTLFSELVNGPPQDSAFILNGGDAGLLASLDKLDAREASQNSHDGASIAAHVAHVRYALSLMNRWAGGEANPFADADWSRAWQVTKTTEKEWAGLRSELREECELWLNNLSNDRDVQPIELNGIIASVAHVAYHLGAMRQIRAEVRGPKESERAAAATS